jgi:hypothetical protein
MAKFNKSVRILLDIDEIMNIQEVNILSEAA